MLRRTGLALALVAALAGCSSGGSGSSGDVLVIYSGRNENLIGPLLKQFEATGVKFEVRYGGTAELAAQLLEEGGNTKADVFLSQDAGALGALAKEGRLEALPQAELDKVPAKYRGKDGTWVGVSGRARVLVYNPTLVPQSDLPKSVFDLADPKWKGKIGIPPTNASFQSFVTAMRLTAGEAKTREWLLAIKDNAKVYEGNVVLRDAVDKGEIAAGLINHYYLHEKIAEVGADKVVAKNHFFSGGDPGALVNVAGVAIVKGADKKADAEKFVTYLLSAEAQRYFTNETSEYSVTGAAPPDAGLPPFEQIQGPNIDLADLATLEDTLKLLNEVGLT